MLYQQQSCALHWPKLKILRRNCHTLLESYILELVYTWFVFSFYCREEVERRWEAQKNEVKEFTSYVSLPFTQTDDFRAPHASSNGGFELTDEVLLGKHRSVISEMISVSSSIYLLLLRPPKTYLLESEKQILVFEFPVQTLFLDCMSLSNRNLCIYSCSKQDANSSTVSLTWPGSASQSDAWARWQRWW